MKPVKLTLVVSLVIASFSSAVGAGLGLPTRDLNPILQPIFLPGYINLSADEGWRVDHSFYITNTMQQKTLGNESLIIDVENYRYELSLGYRQRDWVVQVRLPFTANQGGELDGLIEDWHEAFGLPEGKRKMFPRDQVNIEYVRDGVIEYSQTESSSGVGDFSIAIGHHPANEIGYFIGVELPTGSESDFSGNEAFDIALWLIGDKPINETISLYGLFGISFPGDDGALEGLIVDEIWVAQLGMDYWFTDSIIGFAQLDLHSKSISGSELKAFGESLQIQLGLGFEGLFDNHRLELFFSEDILVRSAPDITFGLRVARVF